MARIDAAGQRVALVVNDDGASLGTITDGNVRRAILKGLGMDTPASQVISRAPITARERALAAHGQTSVRGMPRDAWAAAWEVS
jgi:hypothetical protein